MRLETDPTVIYGIENFDGNLRRRDLENGDNPYNTYRIFGLPPGPIASPGRRRPARGGVTGRERLPLLRVAATTAPTSSRRAYREHTNAVNRFQRRRSR